ncbi:DNA recombination protein RmuC [Bernardetia sp.]|uniref:DNA recombination protein RmuC n=1 Tax=Bernardetia sp. TaxID=1937974 RepID=UPI0025C72410|nr:DNA recombination protein RmuC [Bernardetia sp.]
MENALLWVILIGIGIIIFLLIKLIQNKENTNNNKLLENLQFIERDLQKIEQQFVFNRQELAQQSKESRTENNQTFEQFRETLASVSEKNQDQLDKTIRQIAEAFRHFKTQLDSNRQESLQTILQFESKINETTSSNLENIRKTLEFKVNELQNQNTQKLDEIRVIVDEKLQSTLEKRLGESFKIVSERLELVHKGLGEMQQLANGVGDLKKILNNVKTRGVFGEFQLEAILEQILSNEQYAKNVKPNPNSNAIVEFVLKIPHAKDKNQVVLIPIDAKFPVEDYHSLMDAYDLADTVLIEQKRKSMINRIKSSAKDISQKYIVPPHTTDFAIMFLPFESLYAEVMRCDGLFEQIQRDYKVTITSPTTLSAILNSLQMGFRTLAIEQRSSEVWQLLGSIKNEFSNFGTALEKIQKKLGEASNTLDQANVRSRAIEKQLQKVQEIRIEE